MQGEHLAPHRHAPPYSIGHATRDHATDARPTIAADDVPAIRAMHAKGAAWPGERPAASALAATSDRRIGRRIRRTASRSRGESWAIRDRASGRDSWRGSEGGSR